VNSEYFTAMGVLIVKDVKNKVKVSRGIALTTLNSKKHIISQRFIDMECSLHTQKGSVNFKFYLPNWNDNGEDVSADGSDSQDLLKISPKFKC